MDCPANDADVESDEDEEREAEESEISVVGSDLGNEMEMDDDTRREMAMLQAEDAEFLKGMDELPTDESESDTDLAQFYSDEDEEDENDDEVRANTLRNEQLTSVKLTEESDDRQSKTGQGKGKEESDDEKQLDAKIESEHSEEGDEDKEEEKVVIEEDIYGRPVIKSSEGTKKPSTYLPPHLRRKIQAKTQATAAAAFTDKAKPLQMDEQAMRELTRRINGQLNRLCESNMEYVVCSWLKCA